MGVMLFVIVALVVGLEWSRRRQAGPPEPGGGRSGVQDRDLERLRAELRVLADRES